MTTGFPDRDDEHHYSIVLHYSYSHIAGDTKDFHQKEVGATTREKSSKPAILGIPWSTL